MFSAKCYDYNENLYLIDMIIPDKFKNIRLIKFTVPEEGLPKDCWQVPYMEQYLDIEKDEKICETYDEPEKELSPVRICFFIFKTSGKTLTTPYGDIDLTSPLDLPDSLAKVIEFDEED